MMAVGLRKRVERLEEQHQAADPQRLVFICRGEGESDTEAIERHGLVPGQYWLVILRRYGAAACWCRQRRL